MWEIVVQYDSENVCTRAAGETGDGGEPFGAWVQAICEVAR